jgi:hypothetical protein
MGCTLAGRLSHAATQSSDPFTIDDHALGLPLACWRSVEWIRGDPRHTAPECVNPSRPVLAGTEVGYPVRDNAAVRAFRAQAEFTSVDDKSRHSVSPLQGSTYPFKIARKGA